MDGVIEALFENGPGTAVFGLDDFVGVIEQEDVVAPELLRETAGKGEMEEADFRAGCAVDAGDVKQQRRPLTGGDFDGVIQQRFAVVDLH